MEKNATRAFNTHSFKMHNFLVGLSSVLTVFPTTNFYPINSDNEYGYMHDAWHDVANILKEVSTKEIKNDTK
ncbi:hypothetical protein [Basilea psittacipulmonis]|uniref:Uncharacterized protein n=1 Tax=Basilea psittacipulmonis DSM 24701 TaxID=1072685 RepID=A0A077DDY7_9BURK|nr:hypothetical protein [Basilea psittacipulmonis]AIL32351.1 hypothetical protein IX83_02580 [Basilea psittacipulmonis DSM 24701]